MSREERVAAVPTFDALHRLVLLGLCAHDRLDPEQTPLMRGIIRRGGKPCGLFYQAEGPRLMKSYAVWVGEESRVLFYNSAGERIGEVELSESPDPLHLAA